MKKIFSAFFICMMLIISIVTATMSIKAIDVGSGFFRKASFDETKLLAKNLIKLKLTPTSLPLSSNKEVQIKTETVFKESVATKDETLLKSVNCTKKEKNTTDNNLIIDAKASLLMDFNSGTIIFANNENERLPIASMTKIMTLNLIFEELANKGIALDEDIVVSSYAASMGGSQVFLEADGVYKVEDLIKSIVVASANDASVALAERIGGSIDGFVNIMNDKAKAWKMENTNFANATGLPRDDHYSCAKDVAIMTRELLKHETFFNYSKIWMDEIKHSKDRVTEISNTNRLLKTYSGCDGGKTGYTSEAKHCISATAIKNGMRAISVVIGSPDSKTRFNEAAKMFDYAFGNYENKKILDKETPLSIKINVKGGKEKEVELVAKNNFYVFSKKREKQELKTVYELPECIKAPANKNDIVGKVKVLRDGEVLGEVEVIVLDTVEKCSFWDVIKKVVNGFNI